jgi:phage terminase Nu1 subunit (DNA packaging protein)
VGHAPALDKTQHFQAAGESQSSESNFEDRKFRIAATTWSGPLKKFYCEVGGESAAGFSARGFQVKTYTTKPNARRAARKADLDPDLVRETPDGKFIVDTPAPATIENGQIDLPTIAWLFDCTPRSIQKLASRGVVVRTGTGRFDEKTSIRNYIRHLREQAAGRVGLDPSTDGVAANVEYKQASTELVRLRLRKEAGQVVSVEEVREVWGRIARGLRQFVLALPSKIAFEVPTLNLQDRGVIERICRDGLQDASLERGLNITEPADHDPDAV